MAASKNPKTLRAGMTLAQIKKARPEKNPRAGTRPGSYSMAVSFRGDTDNNMLTHIAATYRKLEGFVTQADMVRLFAGSGLSPYQIVKACRCARPKFKSKP